MEIGQSPLYLLFSLIQADRDAIIWFITTKKGNILEKLIFSKIIRKMRISVITIDHLVSSGVIPLFLSTGIILEVTGEFSQFGQPGGASSGKSSGVSHNG